MKISIHNSIRSIKKAGRKKVRIITSIEEMQSARSEFKHPIKIGFVPTMGFLHEGHLSLVRKACYENDLVIVSIFVNPTQFGPDEDFTRYPRNLSRDLQLLEVNGVDIVFTPAVEEMYPATFATFLEPTGPLANEVEGASRPGHFRGVATVVLKLFQIIQPAHVYFGQKDAQQVAVISRMIFDLNLTVELHVLPIIREADGLAMSSRNTYLEPKDRLAAGVLFRALQAGKKVYETSAKNTPPEVVQAVTDTIMKEPRIHLEYVQLRDPVNFNQLNILHESALLLVAVRVGKTRLIDNFLLNKAGKWETGIIL